jgi:rhodanese-related sulfurtransferase
MMPGAWFGLLAGGSLCGLFAVMFHHYVVRISKARDWLSRGALLVDVDAAGEFARHHPRVAVNIPLENLARRAHELGENKKPLVIFAHSWRRGAQAVHELRGIGFWEVMNAAGLQTKEKLSAEAARAAEARKDADIIELAPKVSEA